MTKSITLPDFYAEIARPHPDASPRETGHFNVFRTADLYLPGNAEVRMPYNRRTYYKISLLEGSKKVAYADKVIETTGSALLFATPEIPYHYVSLDKNHGGDFCVFTKAFISKSNAGAFAEKLPIFRPDGYPVFQLTNAQKSEVAEVFRKMHRAINSDYTHKYDVLLNYVVELIHFGQQLLPAPATAPTSSASGRLVSLFGELLERQFPISAPEETIELRTPNDYAERLSVHVNYLNKALKERTGQTTTAVINGRFVREAKIMLRHSDWSVSEIAYSLGFREVAHFSTFFKKHTKLAPVDFRG